MNVVAYGTGASLLLAALGTYESSTLPYISSFTYASAIKKAIVIAPCPLSRVSADNALISKISKVKW